MISCEDYSVATALESFFAIFLDFFRDVILRHTFIITMIAGTEKKWIKRQTTLASSKTENTDLIKEACSDPDAFAQLYLLHYNDVFHYCIRRLFDSYCAEDVTSTVFFKVMHNLSSFDGKVTDFRNWLLRIATNAVNDHLRNSRRRADIIRKIVKNTRAESDHVIQSDDILLKKKVLLKRALLSLKPKYQTVITLRFFENMKLTEIADCLDENHATVRSQLSRAIVKLREKLVDAKK